MLFFILLNFLLIKENRIKKIMVSTKIQNSTTAFNMDNNKTMLIRIISEGYIKIEWVIFYFFITISQHYCLYCIFDQINAALVSIRNFFKNVHKLKNKH